MVIAFLALLLSFLHPELQVKPKPVAAGTYRCLNVRVDKYVKRCTLPPLFLNEDGTYRLWKEEGTYIVVDKFVILSGAKKRGPGEIKKNRMLVFEFIAGGRRYRVEFQKADVPEEGYRFAKWSR